MLECYLCKCTVNGRKTFTTHVASQSHQTKLQNRIKQGFKYGPERLCQSHQTKLQNRIKQGFKYGPGRLCECCEIVVRNETEYKKHCEEVVHQIALSTKMVKDKEEQKDKPDDVEIIEVEDGEVLAEGFFCKSCDKQFYNEKKYKKHLHSWNHNKFWKQNAREAEREEEREAELILEAHQGGSGDPDVIEDISLLDIQARAAGPPGAAGLAFFRNLQQRGVCNSQ